MRKVTVSLVVFVATLLVATVALFTGRIDGGDFTTIIGILAPVTVGTYGVANTAAKWSPRARRLAGSSEASGAPPDGDAP